MPQRCHEGPKINANAWRYHNTNAMQTHERSPSLTHSRQTPTSVDIQKRAHIHTRAHTYAHTLTHTNTSSRVAQSLPLRHTCRDLDTRRAQSEGRAATQQRHYSSITQTSLRHCKASLTDTSLRYHANHCTVIPDVLLNHYSAITQTSPGITHWDVIQISLQYIYYSNHCTYILVMLLRHHPGIIRH